MTVRCKERGETEGAKPRRHELQHRQALRVDFDRSRSKCEALGCLGWQDALL